ncbi:hypothetical protein [Halorussus salinus]|uniref:hypothetical protein n=1 Tax=Halorussus salinus TaxID=1364935 RepID=UPI001EE4AC11|nr:hypothetical protein [Halorussus salinus]
MTDPDDSANFDTSDDSLKPAELARECLVSDYREEVRTVLDCADAVAESWGSEATTDPAAVADPLRAALDAAGVWSRLPDLLVSAVDATGRSLSATPVAAPPYVTATSRGPMLRATLPDGRLVVSLRVFEIDRTSASDGSVRYVRGATTPEEAVRVEFV